MEQLAKELLDELNKTYPEEHLEIVMKYMEAAADMYWYLDQDLGGIE